VDDAASDVEAIVEPDAPEDEEDAGDAIAPSGDDLP
jgi:hypothetical protein